jgi:asparagine synthase (glutamine-hydrolysing)
MTSSLPTILHYVDRMTMAHSIESRVPFLDHRLIELAFSLSNEDKINKSVTKYILRESLKDVLPEKVYNRRDKKGFVTPGEINWLRKPLRNLLDIDYSNFDYWDKNTTEKIIADYLNGNNKNSKLVWRIATLNYWLKNI